MDLQEQMQLGLEACYASPVPQTKEEFRRYVEGESMQLTETGDRDDPRAERLADEKAYKARRDIRGRVATSPKEEVKTLNLTALFKDASIQMKYGINKKQALGWALAARINPYETANDAQAVIRANGYVGVSVRVDSLKGFISEAKEHVDQLAAGIPWPVAEISLTVIPPQTQMYMLNPPSQDDEWEISSSYAMLGHAMKVWKMCVEWGPRRTVDELAADLPMLSIVITDRTGSELVTEIEYHANVSGVSQGRPYSEPAPANVVQSFGATVRPIMAGGSTVAYAASVGRGWWLLSGHVRDANKDGDCTFMGVALTKYKFVRVQGTLWLMSSMRSAKRPEPPVLYRSPRDGESVRLAFLEEGGWRVSPELAMRLKRNGLWCAEVADESAAASGWFAIPGMSGAVYFSMADFTVVGLHEGYAPSYGDVVVPIDEKSVSARATTAEFERSYSSSSDSKRVLSNTIASMKRDGIRYARLDTIMSALTRVKDEVITETSDGLVTIAAGEESLRFRPTKVPPGFPELGVRIVSEAVVPGACNVASRPPERDESVIVIGRDVAGMFASPETRVRLQSGGHVFTIPADDHIPSKFRGGPVVAVSDAAIVGWVTDITRQSTDGAYRRLCLCAHDTLDLVDVERASVSTTSTGELREQKAGTPIPVEPSLIAIREHLSRTFPYLNANVYDVGLMEEAFTHNARGRYDEGKHAVFAANRYLARVGDSVMSARLMWRFRELGVPDDESTVRKSRIQNNMNQARIADELRLTPLYRVGRNVPVAGEHAKADLLEAVTALVSVHESEGVLDKFLEHIGMVPRVIDGYA